MSVEATGPLSTIAPPSHRLGARWVCGVFVDYDGDGDGDLYAVRFDESNALLRNEEGRLSPLPEEDLAAGYPGATSRLSPISMATGQSTYFLRTATAVAIGVISPI